MYIMIACIGICFAGARAISHAFFSFRVFISSSVGCFRVDSCDFCRKLSADAAEPSVGHTCLAVKDLADEKPGGSAMFAFLDLAGGVLFNSTTQAGGGGAFIVVIL